MEIFDRALASEVAFGSGDYPRGRDPDDNPINLREILTKFWARRRLIFSAIIVCAGISYVMAKMITPTYVGSALVMIKPQQAAEPATNASIQAAIHGGPEAVPSEALVLQSRALANETIKRLNLDQDPEFDPSLRAPTPRPAFLDPVFALLDEIQSLRRELSEFLSGAGGVPASEDAVGATVEPDMPSTAVVDAFLQKLRIEVVPHSNVIRLSFTSSRPKIAAAVPNAMIRLYLEQLANEKDEALAQERKRLDTLVLPTLRERMNASQTALAEYRQKSGLISDQNPAVLAQELNDINAQLSLARARKADVKARLSQIEALVSSPAQPDKSTAASPEAASESAILQQLRDHEVQLKAQLSSLRSILGPSHPRSQQMTAELDAERSALRRESEGVVARLKAEVAGAEATEATLNRRAKEYTQQFALVNGGDMQLQNLIHDADADRQTYERYLARSNEIYANMGHAQPDAQLVSSAAAPLYPSFPNTRLMVLLGAAIGAGFGITLAAIIDLLRGGLRNKKQVEDALGVKCLGSVPMTRTSRPYRRPVPLLQPQGTAFEHAVRNVELKLLSVNRRRESEVVLVTAALPDEGKTWVAANLAASFAADGVSVALVDCDLHRPAVHRMFGGPRGPGLTDYFDGGFELEAIVHNDPISRVSYVPVGTASSQNAWRITPGRLRPLIDRLAEKYAFVILDSAPVLAISETILLSQIAQKTILVVKWGSTPATVARRAATQLLESGGREVGVLLSMVDPKRAAEHGDPVARMRKRLEHYYGRRASPE
jgi:uncharacterized protein involved in exopolysaccharide biosynthesis/Mrp family chromosome partitioning ATPase